MTVPLSSSEAGSRRVGASGLVEKLPLERYVPPAKPSLVGMSRAALADALGTIGIAPAQRKMRVQQLWHWLYVRGTKSFAEMTSVSKHLRVRSTSTSRWHGQKSWRSRCQTTARASG